LLQPGVLRAEFGRIADIEFGRVVQLESCSVSRGS
jgi:hypothetical protein